MTHSDTHRVSFLLDDWLNEVRKCTEKEAPSLLPTLEIYSGEARFGRQFIDNDLKNIPSGAAVLEVGAGSFLLSCQLAGEGFDVTALEPIGEGFGHFPEMQDLILQCAKRFGCVPNLLTIPAEQLSDTEKYDYAFSINVIEHVQNVREVIRNVSSSLKSGSIFHFTCPNYFFPYEPHFNIPTLVSKRLTAYVFKRKIFSDKLPFDAEGLWNSLNWIDVWQIQSIVRQMGTMELSFDRGFLVRTLDRVISDPSFSTRRSEWVRNVIALAVSCRLHLLAALIPPFLQPVIDCKLMKRSLAKEDI
jgi:SAM-dependent methyltransferase